MKIILLYNYIYSYIKNSFKYLFINDYRYINIGKYVMYINDVYGFTILSMITDMDRIKSIIENNFDLASKRICDVYDILDYNFLDICDAYSIYYIDKQGELVKGTFNEMYEKYFRISGNDCIDIDDNYNINNF